MRLVWRIPLLLLEGVKHFSINIHISSNENEPNRFILAFKRQCFLRGDVLRQLKENTALPCGNVLWKDMLKFEILWNGCKQYTLVELYWQQDFAYHGLTYRL